MGVKNYKRGTIAMLILWIFIVISTMYGCASMSAPQGGPKDSLPPRVRSSTPLAYATNFDGKKVELEFNEYVKLKGQSKLFFVSPEQTKKAILTLRGRRLIVNFQDSLLDDQTYRLDFGSSIVDNNEGNPMDGYTFTFSTGDYIDSLIMVGQVLDAYTRDTIVGAFVPYFYSGMDSTLVEGGLDSTLYKSMASALFRTDSSGYFIADILKGEDYRAYAFLDINNNQRYEQGFDMVAFIDGVVNPLYMPGFSFGYDSIKQRMYIDSVQINFELFREQAVVRQNFSTQSRGNRVELMLTFAGPDAVVDSVEVEGIKKEWLVEDWNKTGDTLRYWIQTPTKMEYDSLPDSIKMSFVFEGLDSIGGAQWIGRNVSFYHKLEEPIKDDEDKRRGGREGGERGDEGMEISIDSLAVDNLGVDNLAADSLAVDGLTNDSLPKEPQKNPFAFKVEASAELNPLNNIVFKFNYPLQSLDSTAIKLQKSVSNIKTDGRRLSQREQEQQTFTMHNTPFEIEQQGLRTVIIRADWEYGMDYELMIPAGTFKDITWESNDTLTSKFKILHPDDFGSFVVQLSAEKPTVDSISIDSLTIDNLKIATLDTTTKYILELIEVGGNTKTVVGSEDMGKNTQKIVRRITNAIAGKEFRFDFLPNAKYALRIIEDKNGDQKWTSGDLRNRIQPERSRMFLTKSGRQYIVEAKENREFIEVINLAEIFN